MMLFRVLLDGFPGLFCERGFAGVAAGGEAGLEVGGCGRGAESGFGGVEGEAGGSLGGHVFLVGVLGVVLV